MKVSNLKIILKLLISLIVLLVLIKIIGIEKIVNTLSKINVIYFMPIITIYLIAFVIDALNIRILLEALNKNIEFKKLIKYVMISWSIGLFSPGKIGDFSIIYFLKKEKIQMGKSFAIVFIDKAITVLVLILFTIIASLLLLTKKEFIITLILITIMIILILLLPIKGVRNIIKKYILRKYSKKFRGFYKTIISIIRKNKKSLYLNFFITILKWFVVSTNVLLIFLALGTKANIFMITIIAASLIIVNFIPITFHGIGLKEGAGIYLYGLIGVPAEIVIATYIIFNILAYSISSITIYLLAGEITR